MNCSAIVGPAGSGKSTQLRERARISGESVKLCASTGIAAVNLGPSVTTINSVIGFYDEDSLHWARQTGKFQRRLREVSSQYDTIAIDEVSMISGSVLDSIVDGFKEVEAQPHGKAPDLMVMGDFLQLPPVKGTFAFEARCWPLFAQNIQKLEGSYRQQGDPEFYKALTYARKGFGVDAILQLRKAGVTYRTEVDKHFDGLTITPMNRSVDKINRERFAELSGVECSFEHVEDGVQVGDWKSIPSRVALKVGALVMILANKRDRESKELEYVNGDSGVVEQMHEHIGVTIRLQRNDTSVFVPYVTRRNMVKDRGVNLTATWDEREQRWCIGRIDYLPVRLAYASTTHKAQGLTLSRVQIDTRTRFAGEPGMMYTALSRCREAKDLVVVTQSAGHFARRIQTHAKVREWI